MDKLIRMDRGGIMSMSGRADSTWAPLRVGIFRALWLAVLVSNIGTWMQTVGAQWLLVNQPHASILVALVQTADMLPDALFAYVGGVLADTFDRRWLLIINGSKPCPLSSQRRSCVGIVRVSAYSGSRSQRCPLTNRLIKTMAKNNRLWGAERIRDELLKLGIRVLKAYVEYFNHMRPHQGIKQQVPESLGSPVPPEQSGGQVIALTILGGLHHDYRRTA